MGSNKRNREKTDNIKFPPCQAMKKNLVRGN